MKETDRIEEELHNVELLKDKLQQEMIQHNKQELEIFNLFENKESFFNEMFDHWKKGEMRNYLFQTYSDIKSAEKQIIYTLDEQSERLRKERNELEMERRRTTL